MQDENTISIDFIFNIGDSVKEKNTDRSGTVIKRYSKLIKKTEDHYEKILSYTVLPLKESQNNFRVKESELVLLIEDEEGRLHQVPHGVRL